MGVLNSVGSRQRRSIERLYSDVVNVNTNWDARFLPDVDLRDVEMAKVYSVCGSSLLFGLKLKFDPGEAKIIVPSTDGEVLIAFLTVPESIGAVRLNVIKSDLLNAIFPFTGTVEEIRKGVVEKRTSKGEAIMFPSWSCAIAPTLSIYSVPTSSLLIEVKSAVIDPLRAQLTLA